jgi:topoisomerase-4 subunit A
VLSQKAGARVRGPHRRAALGREGDGFRSQAAKGKTTQNVAFIDSTGRSYSADHALPLREATASPRPVCFRRRGT